MSTLVSVYIPTRNRRKLLLRAIHSAISQDYDPLEVIVADDASDDGTGDEVAQLSQSNRTEKRLIYLRLPRPMGANAARNLAINAASGEYVTGLDDDDYFLPGRISRLVAAFDPARCAFVFSGCVREFIRTGQKTRRVAVHHTKPANLPELLRRNIVGNQVLTLSKRLRQLGGYAVDLPAWQDYDMWIRLVKSYGTGKPVPGFTYVNTITASTDRISNHPSRVCQAFDIFREKHEEYRDPQLLLCLKLAKASYGIDALNVGDWVAAARLREPRLVFSSLAEFIYNKYLQS